MKVSENSRVTLAQVTPQKKAELVVEPGWRSHKCLFLSFPLSGKRSTLPEKDGEFLTVTRVRLILTKELCPTWCFIFCCCS